MLDTELLKQTPSMLSLHSSASSMTVSNDQKQADSLQQLQADVARYGRANDRRMILRSIDKVRAWLLRIPLPAMQPPPYSLQLEDLEAEALEEVVLLNGIPFKPYGMSMYGKPRSNANSLSNRNALVMLRELCNELCRANPNLTVSPQELYEQLIWRISKTTASIDALAQLSTIFASGSELSVHPITSATAQAAAAAVAAIRQPTGLSGSGSSHSSLSSMSSQQQQQQQQPNSNRGAVTIISSNSNPNSNVLTPMELNVYVDKRSHAIHLTTTSTFSFGLFRRNDSVPGRPWIAITVGTRERTNLSSQSTVRSMSLRVPDLGQ